MDKIIEALKKILPEEQVKEVATAVQEMLEEAKKEIETSKEAEFNKQLEKAYASVAEELSNAEQIGEKGYGEAATIITDLQHRLDNQQVEMQKTIDEGFEEAYQMILAERAKVNNVEVGLYEEYDKKYNEQREFFVDMIDKFMVHKGREIHEQVVKDVINDPRYAEDKVALNRIVDIVSRYITNEEYSLATSSRLEEASKKIEDLNGQLKLAEARSIRTTLEKTKLEEAVRQHQEVVTEATKTEKNERTKKAQTVTGRGRVVTEEETKVIAEHSHTTSNAKDTKNSVLAEALGYKNNDELSVLAGTKVIK